MTSIARSEIALASQLAVNFNWAQIGKRLAYFFPCFDSPYLSISPITISSEPTIAGTSAIRQPRQISGETDKLQKQLLRARARQGIEPPSLTM